MIKKILIAFLVCFPLALPAHTLIVDGKKSGHNTEMHMTYNNVAQAGYNIMHTYMVRFYDGHEISLGKRSHWEKFNTFLVNDHDELRP